MKALVCALVVLVAAAPVSADTYVTSHIMTNTTWDLAGSPYIIQGDINGDIWVDSGSTLTIDPGVIVRFAADVRLEAHNGSAIHAVGTPGNPILFTSDSGTPAPGDWDSFGLNNGASSEFSHCVIEYGKYNLYLFYSDPALVSYCTIRYCQTDGIRIEATEATITNCSIVNNMRAIKIVGPDVSPVINYCDIYDNNEYNLWVGLYEQLPVVTINAENNWWGTDIEEEIGWWIYIHSSGEGFVEVDFDPWLHDTPVDDTVTWGRIKALFAD